MRRKVALGRHTMFERVGWGIKHQLHVAVENVKSGLLLRYADWWDVRNNSRS